MRTLVRVNDAVPTRLPVVLAPAAALAFALPSLLPPLLLLLEVGRVERPHEQGTVARLWVEGGGGHVCVRGFHAVSDARIDRSRPIHANRLPPSSFYISISASHTNPRALMLGPRLQRQERPMLLLRRW